MPVIIVEFMEIVWYIKIKFVKILSQNLKKYCNVTICKYDFKMTKTLV